MATAAMAAFGFHRNCSGPFARPWDNGGDFPRSDKEKRSTVAGKAIPKFETDKASNVPLWVQLRDRFVFLISSGYYEPDEQLPSVRKFAAENHVSLNTVSKAFMALEREGYIVTRHGSGAYVRGKQVGDDCVSEIDIMTEDYVRSCLERGAGIDDIPRFVSEVIARLKAESGEEGESSHVQS